ncbi:hypothetical protein CROQUDRAFT_656965 [Cronartium quercuum f. sp. fusiforme G11]|uniref:Uncharacterized protein n=1 Tax=Cronartium quercuum f. sp. fusiforme G11 TaxID=708437 RepID=A0A9P6NNL2_9BASI|nr:hypothetical protein CROQUDRAFT_656965 [Cronartium quercuum f. sp. fusiforme G11]
MTNVSPINSPDDGFHCLRITPNTKISGCVSIALTHLKKVDSIPLCLHTLPSSSATAESVEKTIAASKRNPSNNSVGRLISIVEIIKREFESEHFSGSTTDKSITNTLKAGLHQYNQIGSLESWQAENEEMRLGDELKDVIEKISERHDLIVKEFLNEERKRPRRTHTPYMKIYLSRSPISSLEGKSNIYHQQPTSTPRRGKGTSQPVDVSMDSINPVPINHANTLSSEVAPV